MADAEIKNGSVKGITPSEPKPLIHPGIVIHGGAWNIPDNLADGSREGVRRAAERGYRVLMEGGSALDAVEQAVRELEDDPVFDAGTGSVLTAAGDIEMDAVIMEGAELKSGGVACVKHVKNPVSLARLVMDKTDHTLLVGKGADDFGVEMGVPQVPITDLLSEESKKEHERYLTYGVSVTDLINSMTAKARVMARNASHDTVGAAALDLQGNTAYATSTGGINAKRSGRVGDAPIVGAGGYADNTVGALSCTGHGESISKICLAHRVINNITHGMTAENSLKEGLDYMQGKVGGCGGAVMITKGGQTAHYFTTERMAWATVTQNQLLYGLNPGEVIQETITSI